MIGSAHSDPTSLNLSGKSVVIAGRLETIGRRTAVDLVKARGGTVRRSLGRRTGCLVVGHDATGLLENGGLRARIEAADRNAVPCLSENGFLRALGDAAADGRRPRGKVEPREDLSFSSDDIKRTAGLAGDDLRILGLLDIIDLDQGRGGFEAMVAARQAARLLRAGCTLADIAASVARMRRRVDADGSGAPGYDNPLACHHFDLDDQRTLVVRVGNHAAEVCGQLRLPLPDAGNPGIPALMDRAAAAEETGDWSTAEALYRRCIMVERHDPTAPFNLANMLRDQDRPREADLFFRLALSRDQDFAEAWYNLGCMAEAAGGAQLACDCLDRALHCDPAFADAAFNLARLRYGLGDVAAAASCWELYLELDPDSTWARKARHGLALCRRRLGGEHGE